MSQPTEAIQHTTAWLVSRSGALTGTRYALTSETTRIGRGPDNEIVIRGPDAASVSLHHAEIQRDETGFKIHDLGSTNGTYLNGERITEARLVARSTVRLGPHGPQFEFVLEEPAPVNLDQTAVISKDLFESHTQKASPPPRQAYDSLLTDAVARARHIRSAGVGDQTMLIMREALDRALRHKSRGFRLVIAILVAALVGMAGGGYWKISQLKREKRSIDSQIQEIEARLQATQASPDQEDTLLAQLAQYQNQAEQLRRNMFYRVGVREDDTLVTREIRSLMAEFGAEVYSIPQEFSERVNHYIEEYQGPNRPNVARALGESRDELGTMRHVLQQEQLPPDLAYIPLVESALTAEKASSAGAAGMWQFTPSTARAYGLRVDSKVDERLNLEKATRAGCRYLRELILDFGSGSSVMLALAAYNLGPSRVKQAVMKTVRDPIKQRNFWYLYRRRALPAETREYVPKVMAAMIIGRNPRQFGF